MFPSRLITSIILRGIDSTRFFRCSAISPLFSLKDFRSLLRVLSDIPSFFLMVARATLALNISMAAFLTAGEKFSPLAVTPSIVACKM